MALAYKTDIMKLLGNIFQLPNICICINSHVYVHVCVSVSMLVYTLEGTL